MALELDVEIWNGSMQRLRDCAQQNKRNMVIGRGLWRLIGHATRLSFDNVQHEIRDFKDRIAFAKPLRPHALLTSRDRHLAISIGSPIRLLRTADTSETN